MVNNYLFTIQMDNFLSIHLITGIIGSRRSLLITLVCIFEPFLRLRWISKWFGFVFECWIQKRYQIFSIKRNFWDNWLQKSKHREFCHFWRLIFLFSNIPSSLKILYIECPVLGDSRHAIGMCYFILVFKIFKFHQLFQLKK